MLLLVTIPFAFVFLLYDVVGLKPEDKLTTSCYGFPSSDFSFQNNIKNTYNETPHLILNTDDEAIDFTLLSYEGKTSHKLSNLLATKPVVLIWGMATCPAFNGYAAEPLFPSSGYENENTIISSYHKKAFIVHIISSEPHPVWPDANFDTGNVRLNYWSTIQQPREFDDRMTYSVIPVVQRLDSNAIILVDDLDDDRANPVWCSYSHGARSAFIISQEGKIEYTQRWFEGEEFAAAFETLYGA